MDTVGQIKRCSKCREHKPIHAFRKDKSKLDGHRYSCRTCEIGHVSKYLQPIQVFWSHVDIAHDDTSCWEWKIARDQDGYGAFTWSRKAWKAHRFAWAIVNGWPPPDKVVCHRCDNPGCVRPDHLFLGTPADNNRDRHVKGRDARGDASGLRLHPELVAKGERNANSILTDAAVRRIRELDNAGVVQRRISEMYGVSLSCIERVIERRSWKHVG
jgi:hypothetical protein